MDWRCGVEWWLAGNRKYHLGSEECCKRSCFQNGTPWIRRDTVVNCLGKASARLRTAEWRQDLRCNQTGNCGTSLARYTSLRGHLLLKSRVYNTYALMAAEVRAMVMARTTWSGPTPMDLSILAKDAVEVHDFCRLAWYCKASLRPRSWKSSNGARLILKE